MSKRTIAGVFFASLAALATSIVLFAIGFLVALQQNVFIMEGPDVVGVRSGTSAGMVLTLGVLGLLLGVASGLGGFASWLGALAATGGRPDKTWFVVLLLLGLLSIGFLATLIYLVAGPPDDPAESAPSGVAEGEVAPALVAR